MDVLAANSKQQSINPGYSRTPLQPGGEGAVLRLGNQVHIVLAKAQYWHQRRPRPHRYPHKALSSIVPSTLKAETISTP